jgi:hypothetical protein
MQPEPLDLVALLIVLLAFIVSKDVAIAVGPYAAICVLACAGAGVSLSGNDRKMELWEGCWYVGIRVILAVALTVGLAELLQKIAPWLAPRYTLIPLAFGLGWIRDYDSVRKWFGDLISRFINRKADGQ